MNTFSAITKPALAIGLAAGLLGQAATAADVRRRSDPPIIQSSWDDLLDGVKTPGEWKQRKAGLRQRYLRLLRDEFKPAKPSLDLRVHERVVVDGVYERRLVSYRVEEDERGHAYLAVPLKHTGRLPAVVALQAECQAAWAAWVAWTSKVLPSVSLKKAAIRSPFLSDKSSFPERGALPH